MDTTRSLQWLARRRDALPIRPINGLLVSLAVIVCWALWAVVFNVGQFGDNIEQFNWAQSLEWGYHKHPPLPTWLLGATIALFGPSPYWTYLLAALCLIGTALFTWLIGRQLLGERAASAAIVLWGLHLYFSQRAQLYNHNTVLVLWMSATVWFALRARDGGLGWWLATGAAAGAAILSKYQAVVPLAGLLLVLAWTGQLRATRQRAGFALAVVMLLAILAPHAVWLVQNDFAPFHYASEAVASAGFWRRLGFLVSFFANQVRLFFPTLVVLGVCWALARYVDGPTSAAEPQAAADTAREPRNDFRIWSIGLIWWTVGVLIVMALVGSVSLRNHWGMQTFQFLCLWLAWRWDRRAPIDLRRLIAVALLVHGVSLALYAAEHHNPRSLSSKRRIDTMYPAQRIADVALAHWKAQTNCPLEYVSGDEFLAGMASLYSRDRSAARPLVYNTPAVTPWIRPEATVRAGMLFVVDEDEVLPDGLEQPEILKLLLDDGAHQWPKTIRIAMRPPSHACN
ncbi:MAG TPA: glycosyltransferase family 39 protein [Burkholderiaceae bacterium]|nr:glycosyltransferase family 39 protein [Burkholderiaceae bacterium]